MNYRAMVTVVGTLLGVQVGVAQTPDGWKFSVEGPPSLSVTVKGTDNSYEITGKMTGMPFTARANQIVMENEWLVLSGTGKQKAEFRMEKGDTSSLKANGLVIGVNLVTGEMRLNNPPKKPGTCLAHRTLSRLDPRPLIR